MRKNLLAQPLGPTRFEGDDHRELVLAKAFLLDEQMIGISETKPGSGISLFPNPVYTTLNILFSEIPDDAVTVSIFGADGALKFRKVLELSGAAITLPLTETRFPQGVYLVAIESNGRRYSERILKY